MFCVVGLHRARVVCFVDVFVQSDNVNVDAVFGSVGQGVKEVLQGGIADDGEDVRAQGCDVAPIKNVLDGHILKLFLESIAQVING